MLFSLREMRLKLRTVVHSIGKLFQKVRQHASLFTFPMLMFPTELTGPANTLGF